MGTRIASWNVNGIRSVDQKGKLNEWLEETSPDVFCLQETKAHPDQLSQELLNLNGYRSYFSSAEKKGYSGVATYTKLIPSGVEYLGEKEFDCEGRVMVTHFSNISLINCYFPNSQEKGKRLNYKLEFCQALLERAKKLEKMGQKLIICGDYNIAHREIDLANPDANRENPGFLPEECEWMDHFLNSGYIDAFRLFDSTPDNYTWWSYRTRARERNAGWRIDYHCISEALKDEVVSCTIQSNIYGSDHCPVLLELNRNLQG